MGIYLSNGEWKRIVDVATLKAMVVAARVESTAAEAKAATAVAEAARAAASASSAEALIAYLKLAIEKLKRELHGSRSERWRKLLDQMELELEESRGLGA